MGDMDLMGRFEKENQPPVKKVTLLLVNNSCACEETATDDDSGVDAFAS